MNTTEIKEGQQICTVGRAGAKCAYVRGIGHFPIFTGKVYTATRTKRGLLVWKLTGYFGDERSAQGRPSPRHVAELQQLAAHPWRDSCEQWAPCNPRRCPQPVLSCDPSSLPR